MSTPNSWLVVGLGNPGPAYASHRHNVGYMVVDELARRAQVRFSRVRLTAIDAAPTHITAGGIGQPGISAEKVVLLKSRTFMNDSGRAVGKAASYFQTNADHIVVVHDELDLDFAQLRLKIGGGNNGHNGLKSIQSALGTADFYRIRFGIGRPPGRQDPRDFVLTGFSTLEKKTLALEISRAADAVETLILQGLERAQNTYNS